MSLQLFTQFGIYPSSQQGNFAEATGGQWVYEINDGGTLYRVHEFTEGTNDFEVLQEGDFEYLLVGSGGGGANDGGEGGLGGQVISGTTTLSTGTYSITVGAFGTGGDNANGTSGGNTTAFGFTANGGAGGQTQSGDGSDGADGILSTITGDSIQYGADGGNAGGPSGNEYGIGGATGGGDAADDHRRQWNTTVFAYKGKSGMGAGGGGSDFSGSITDGGAGGGYGRVIVRYEIGNLTSSIQYPLKPRPQPPSEKWYASWNSANYWVGNTIKHQGNVTVAESMRNSSGNPWSGAPVIAVIPNGLDQQGDEASWTVQLNEQKIALQNIGSDNVYFVFLGDEPSVSISVQERMIETARSVLNTNGHDFKFCFTYTYFNSFDGINNSNDQVPGNLDYAEPNYYPYRENSLMIINNNFDETSFKDNYDDLVGRMWDKIGPNTRLTLTGQFFYDWNNVGDWEKPPDQMPFWLAEKVINDSRVDGIIWWRYLNQGGGLPGKGGEHSTMDTFRANVEAAYTQYFANQ